MALALARLYYVLRTPPSKKLPTSQRVSLFMKAKLDENAGIPVLGVSATLGVSNCGRLKRASRPV
jgi:hypothetical protein